MFTTAGSMIDNSKKRKYASKSSVSGGQPGPQARVALKKRLGCARSGFVPPHRSGESQDRNNAPAGNDIGAGNKNSRCGNDASGTASDHAQQVMLVLL